MTARDRIVRLLAVPVFAAAFGGAYLAAAPSPAGSLRDALEVVRADPAHTVCAGPAPCIDPAAERTLFVFFSPRDCPGGLHETAALEEAYRALPRRSLNVVGVAAEMTREEAIRFVQASGITYPVYVGEGGLEPYLRTPRAPEFNRPVSVLVRRDGRVEGRHVAGTTLRSHRARVAALLAGAEGGR